MVFQSSYSGDEIELDEDDCTLLESVIDSLQTCLHKIRKVHCFVVVFVFNFLFSIDIVFNSKYFQLSIPATCSSQFYLRLALFKTILT